MAAAGRHPRDRLPLLSPPDAVFTLLTDDPALARVADCAGVDRIGPDFERLGKRERQPDGRYRISAHRRDALPALRTAVSHGALFARTDPVHPRTNDEVAALLQAGVEVLMLPMVETPEAAARFVAAVGGHARAVLLVERAEAVRRLPELLAVPGVDEIHVGLNDLALDLGVADRFSLLASPLVIELARRVHRAGLPLGIAGVGRVDDRRLPVTADLVYAGLAALGATGTLLARSFLTPNSDDLARAVREARERLAWWTAAPAGLRAEAMGLLAAGRVPDPA